MGYRILRLLFSFICFVSVMRAFSVTLQCMLAWCFCTAVALGDMQDRASLPALNVDFDFAAKDVAGGNAKIKRQAELRGFKERASQLLASVNKDEDALAKFESVASQEIDDL